MSDAELAALSPEDAALYAATVEGELLLRSPADFAAALSAGRWLPYRHLAATSRAMTSLGSAAAKKGPMKAPIIPPITSGSATFLEKLPIL